MPTASKLVAALMMGVLIWGIAYFLVRPELPDWRPAGQFVPISAVIGCVVGWRVIGARAGGGWGQTAGVGMTGAAVTLVICLFSFAAFEMYVLSLQGRYRDPLTALLDVFDIAGEFLLTLITPMTGLALLIGSVGVALVSEGVSRMAK